MDDLDRIYQRLVHSIRQRNPEYLTVPFTVQELYEDLIPYRHHRRELGIETNQDYETAIGRLLAGERGYLRGDPKMEERLKAEVGSATGDSGAFREFASTRVTLSPEGLKTLGVETPTHAASTPVVAPVPPPASIAYTPAAPSAPSHPPYPATIATGAGPRSGGADATSNGSCRFCAGQLPPGRSSTYCPHCGQNLSVKNCPACGTELDNGWKFCVTCGRSVG